MKRLSCLLLSGAVLFALPAAGRAQRGADPARRFGVGQKLRRFETAYDEQTDPAARQRALAKLRPITVLFFSGKLDEVARTLDQARFALRSDREPEPAAQWAESLWARPATRLLDAKEAELAVTVEPFYKVKAGPPKDAKVRLTLGLRGEKPQRTAEQPVEKLPLEVKVPVKGLAEGDYQLAAEVLAGDKVLARTEQAVSVAANLDERLAKLRKAVEALPAEPATADKLTLRERVKLLTGLRRKEMPETVYPAAKLLAEAEAVAEGRERYGHKRPGQFWLTLPAGKEVVHVRLLAPEAAKSGKPLPLVLALHGAGGSENLFFDGYGRGAAVKQCEQRGWLLVAPRSAGLFRGPRLPELIDEVAKLYPVDRKSVFVMGHSMGAGQAVTAAGQAPEKFAAVAALGGGGQVKASDGLKAVPFFVGVGSEDFAAGGARQLSAALKRADVKKVEFKEYKGVEHLVVVQEAMKDVFAFFDAAAKGR
ncbi:MAG TPA: alpha/beta hydrolase-fold protein [Gemmataceae bacterium]|nr:alpha/beta hydrolase-fold protein [Gemmataceae bacterium]